MSFELFHRGGSLNAKKIGQDKYSLTISLPKDEHGRQARECPNASCSPGYFKVKSGTGITGGQTVAYCPYCQKAAEPSDFNTKEQVRYAKDLVMREAKEGIERAMRDALGLGSARSRRFVHGVISLDVEMKSSPPAHVRKPYEEVLQRDLVCPHCTLDHSVYGLATWCPDCGKDIFSSHVQGEIRVIEAVVGDVDRRRQLLGRRVAARDLENALEDLVSVFEVTLKLEIRRYRKLRGDTDDQIDTTLKKIGSRLQSVSNAVSIVPQYCDGILLFNAASTEEHELERVFQKRHPIAHNLGVVDRKYIDRVRSGEAEGTELRIEKDEIVGTAQITFATLSQLHDRLFPVGPN